MTMPKNVQRDDFGVFIVFPAARSVALHRLETARHPDNWDRFGALLYNERSLLKDDPSDEGRRQDCNARARCSAAVVPRCDNVQLLPRHDRFLKEYSRDL